MSCSAETHSIPEKGTIEGTIFSIGNEPFTKLGLQTKDGTMYILKCTKEIESELRMKQGITLKIRYNGTLETPEGRVITVLKIE